MHAQGMSPAVCNETERISKVSRVQVADSVPEELQLVCFDPQTSGGLLLAADSATIDTYCNSDWNRAGCRTGVSGE